MVEFVRARPLRLVMSLYVLKDVSSGNSTRLRRRKWGVLSNV